MSIVGVAQDVELLPGAGAWLARRFWAARLSSTSEKAVSTLGTPGNLSCRIKRLMNRLARLHQQIPSRCRCWPMEDLWPGSRPTLGLKPD